MTALSDPRFLLLDIDKATERIEGYMKGVGLDDYVASAGIQDKVERNFITIGEAVGVLKKTAPELADRIPDARGWIDFRNRLVHGYNKVNPNIVWGAAADELPILRRTVRSLLEKLDRTPYSEP